MAVETPSVFVGDPVTLSEYLHSVVTIYRLCGGVQHLDCLHIPNICFFGVKFYNAKCFTCQKSLPFYLSVPWLCKMSVLRATTQWVLLIEQPGTQTEQHASWWEVVPGGIFGVSQGSGEALKAAAKSLVFGVRRVVRICHLSPLVSAWRWRTDSLLCRNEGGKEIIWLHNTTTSVETCQRWLFVSGHSP